VTTTERYSDFHPRSLKRWHICLAGRREAQSFVVDATVARRRVPPNL